MTEITALKKLNKSSKKELEDQNKLSLTDDILRLVWREHKISRAEISRRLGLSRSTVTDLMKDLINLNFISEDGVGESSGGRKPIVLKFNDDSRVVLGIDIGAANISVVMTNLRGKLLMWKEIKYPARNDPEGSKRIINELCNECVATVKDADQTLLSIGVSFPSPIDPKHPEYISENIIPDWHGKSGIEELRDKFNVPVCIDNDANLGALAEHWWGAARSVDDLLYIRISNGIGAGLILGGKLYRGAKGIAGEMSHMSVDPNGKQCGCGLRGCLATTVSAWALEARVATLSVLYPDSPLVKGESDIIAIENAALNNDPLALQIVSEAAEQLSIAITSLINILNPEMILLGGNLTRLDEILLKPIRAKMEVCSLVSTVNKPQLRIGTLGSKAIAIGAATLAIQQAFSDPKLLRKNITPGVLQ
ncbi:MAG: ROK family transcriptional regulator [Melioribacteraceae bacterium]|nr:ROK family transcriptional regulator [Melioribacteraceae bacterium]